MKALKAYLAASPRGTATRLAEHLGVSVVVVSQWVADENPKSVPAKQRVGIEQFTEGTVPVESFDAPAVRWCRVKDPSWPWNGGKPLHDVLPEPSHAPANAAPEPAAEVQP